MAGGLATSARHAVEAGFTTARLMEYSERFLARAAQAELPQASQIAARLLQDPPLQQWLADAALETWTIAYSEVGLPDS